MPTTLVERPGSETVRTRNFDLQAAETTIGRGRRTDPEMTTITTSAPNPLLRADMPAVPKRGNETGIRPAAFIVAQQYESLATPQEQQSFKDFGKRYHQLEKQLVALESPHEEKRPGLIVRTFSGISDWLKLRSVKNEIEKVRKEEQKLIDLVHQRAETLDTRLIRITKDMPGILQRASVPVARQGHLPRYPALVSALAAQVEQRSTQEKPLSITQKDNLVVISRKNENGQTESMMFSYREDGKVSYYRKSGADTEWKREATIWNDGAHSISIAFMKGKSFPKVIKPSENTKRVIAPVEYDDDWKPAPERRVR